MNTEKATVRAGSAAGVDPIEAFDGLLSAVMAESRMSYAMRLALLSEMERVARTRAGSLAADFERMAAEGVL